MASSSSTWFESTPSSFSQDDRKLLRRSFGISRVDHHIRIPCPEDRPHLPPAEEFATFFIGQIFNGLRFPLHPFFAEVSTYFQIPLSQFTPNSFRVLCGVAIVFRYYHIPLTPENFHFFFVIKTKEVGVFYFAARPSTKFLSNFPTSHKYWKNKYFYIRPPLPFPCPISWITDLPPAPELGPFKEFDSYQEYSAILADLDFDVNLLLDESLLFHFGLSPTEKNLVGALGICTRSVRLSSSTSKLTILSVQTKSCGKPR